MVDVWQHTLSFSRKMFDRIFHSKLIAEVVIGGIFLCQRFQFLDKYSFFLSEFNEALERKQQTFCLSTQTGRAQTLKLQRRPIATSDWYSNV